MTLPALPHSTRNQVFTALMTYLQQNVTSITDPSGNQVKFQTYSQLWQQWDQVNDANQPALFLRRGPQAFIQDKAYGVTKLKFKVTVWVYFRTDAYKVDPNYPDQLTDPFIDSFEAAFQSTPGMRLTLNNTVNHCWIDGQVFCDPGLADNQAVIVIPLSIIV